MITIKRTFCPGRGMIRPEELTGYVFSPEAAAHMFIITKMEKVDGQEAAVPFDAGTDISCRFIKANGVTELVDGDLTDDGAASITLPAECYQVPGRFILSIYAETSEETICIYSATATALAGDTEEINVSGNTKRTIDAQIAALNDAVENAQETVEQVQEVIDSIPQDYTALSNSVSDLKSALNYTEVELEKNKGINTAGTNATPVLPENMGSGNSYSGAVVSCTPGEVFQITGKGGDGPRLWAFADNEGTVLVQEVPSAERVDYLVTAPSDAAYFAYNCRNDYAGTPKVYRNGTPDVRLKKVESATVDSALGYIKNTSYTKPVVTRLKYIEADGTVASSGKFAGTDLFAPERNIAIGIENDLYAYQIAGYSANGDASDGTGFIGKTNPMNKPMVIPNDWKKIAVMVFRKDNKNIVSGTSETTTIRNALTFYTLVDPELTVPYVPADAKVTGDRLSAVEQIASAAFPGCLNIVSINHRGYHVNAPENTLPAFIQSRKMGFDAVETDVRFTQDGVPVLLHNDTLDGICCLASDGSAITGNLAINSLDSSELSAYDACSPAKWATYKGTKIPTLREFLVLCRKIGLHPYLEIKQGATSELVATCINVAKECGMLDHVVWFSSDKTVLGHVHTALPEATLAIYEDETILDSDITDALALKTAGNEVIMWVHTSENLSANITKCKNAGLTLYLGTNEINDILSIDPYISGVNSDTLHAGKILFDSVMNAE